MARVNRHTGFLLVGCALLFAAYTGEPAAANAEDGEWSQPAPTAHYASLLAARDSIGAIITKSVSSADTAIHVSRRAVTFG